MAGKGGLAEQIRAGLEQPKRANLVLVTPVSKLDRVWHGKRVRQHIREFAALISFILLACAGYVLYRNGSLATVGGLVLSAVVLSSLGYLAPTILHPVWDGWMYLAEKMGVVMTFLILMIAWVGMMVPMGAILKLLGVKVMDTTFRMPVESYWDTRADKLHDFQLLRRQF